MEEKKINRKDAVIQNLEDAGCSEDMIEQYCSLEDSCEVKEQMCFLEKHRKELLNQVHENQKKLDCLDYLIYQMKRKEK